MKRLDVITLLTQSKTTLAERYGVTQLALFGGPTAQDRATADNDIHG